MTIARWFLRDAYDGTRIDDRIGGFRAASVHVSHVEELYVHFCRVGEENLPRRNVIPFGDGVDGIRNATPIFRVVVDFNDEQTAVAFSLKMNSHFYYPLVML